MSRHLLHIYFMKPQWESYWKRVYACVEETRKRSSVLRSVTEVALYGQMRQKLKLWQNFTLEPWGKVQKAYCVTMT